MSYLAMVAMEEMVEILSNYWYEIKNFWQNDNIDLNDETIISPAGFFRRLAAGMIDFTIILFLSSCIEKITSSRECLICGIYYIIFLLSYQTTIGGKILNIYSLRNNGDRMSSSRIMLKSYIIFLFVLSGYMIIFIITMFGAVKLPFEEYYLNFIIIFSISLLTSLPMIFTKYKRSFIDILSGTKVVYVSKEE